MRGTVKKHFLPMPTHWRWHTVQFSRGGRCIRVYGGFSGFWFPILNRRHFPSQRMMCPYDHEDNTQPPCPPQYHFSLDIAWLMKRYSAAHIPETRKIRFSACHPPSSRPPSRLQLHRNVMMSTSKWTMDNNRRLERSL